MPAFPLFPWAPAGVAALLLTLGGPAFAQAQAQTQTQPQAQATLAPIVVRGGRASLTSPATPDARDAMAQIPGGASLVADTAWRETQALTVKDMLDYTPGVFAQPKWGEDARLSIRGSGLSRYYHLRGIALYQDGVPLNHADGSSDFQRIDPTAYRHVEVYKGANALRYGAGTLGGAINFVTPTGHDASPFQARADLGSFGWRRLQLSSGFAGDTVDGFISGSWQSQSGFREQSGGNALRASANLGWRLADNVETRLYLSGFRIRQRIPGSVTREQALTAPRRAAQANRDNDWQLNLDGGRIANRTVVQAGPATYEFGAWLAYSDLHHPIYQYVDRDSTDYGAYARLVDERQLGRRDNRFTLGLTWAAGKVNASNYVNTGGRRLEKLSASDDLADNLTLYGENAWEIAPGLTLVAGLQYQHATRQRKDRYNGGLPATRSGTHRYHLLNPKFGVLWQVAPGWQVFGNWSRSSEAPTLDDIRFAAAGAQGRLEPQRATTLEIGSRGQSADFAWEISLYHTRLRNEFQCLSTMWNICDQTINLDRSLHQGVEAGLQWTLRRGLLVQGAAMDSLQLNASYTYSRFRFDGDARWGKGQIPGVPSHYLRAELLYRHPSGFYTGPNVEWVPQGYYVDNANTTRTGAYALLGWRAGLERGRYTLFIEGRNLSNRRYIASASITDRAHAGSALFEPGTGRAVFAGMQLRY